MDRNDDGRCDFCGGDAAWRWERTEKQRRTMRRKYRGQSLEVLPVAQRCDAHLPRLWPEWASQYHQVAELAAAA